MLLLGDVDFNIKKIFLKNLLPKSDYLFVFCFSLKRQNSFYLWKITILPKQTMYFDPQPPGLKSTNNLLIMPKKISIKLINDILSCLSFVKKRNIFDFRKKYFCTQRVIKTKARKHGLGYKHS